MLRRFCAFASPFGQPRMTSIASTIVIIGPPSHCARLEQQLDLLGDERPVTLGWITPPDNAVDQDHEHEQPILGTLNELEAIVAQRKPGAALVSFPAIMTDCITSIRTRLRRLEIPDRFMPTLEDQLAGIGPRTQLDIDPVTLLGRPARSIDEDAVGDILTGRTILITGAGGSIGSELARIAAKFEPARIICVDRSENALFEIDRQIARQHASLPRTALLHDVVDDRATLRHVADLRPDIIFHAAAHKHVPMMEDHPLAAVRNNVQGTKSVADAAHIVGVERFVMISTDKAVNPSSIMGATKRLAELYVQHVHVHSPTSFSMVRFGNVLGSAGSVLETWSRQIADGGPITVTHPDMTRYFMTIPEAASLVMQSATLQDPAAPCGEVFLLDMGDPINIADLADRFIDAHGLTPIRSRTTTRREDDAVGCMPVVFTGPRPGEKLHEDLSFDAERMTQTRHPDIHIWQQQPPDSTYIEHIIHATSQLSYRDDPSHISAVVRSLVPEMTEPVCVVAV